MKEGTLLHKLYAKAFNINASLMNRRIARLPDTDIAFSASHISTRLLILTVAFNKPNLIEAQIDTVRRRCQDKDFVHVIADNSNKPEARQAIQALCQQLGVPYIAIPPAINKMAWTRLFYFGISHGAALNYVFDRFVRTGRFQAEFIALLDHDLFPLRPFSLTDHISDHPFYGSFRWRGQGGKYWYLWPGYAVYRTELFNMLGHNFMPMFIGETYLDAGGGNYPKIYRQYTKLQSFFSQVNLIRIRKTNNKDVGHSDYIEIIDQEWVHLVNGSNYAGISDKTAFVDKLTQNIDSLAQYLDAGDTASDTQSNNG